MISTISSLFDTAISKPSKIVCRRTDLDGGFQEGREHLLRAGRQQVMDKAVQLGRAVLQAKAGVWWLSTAGRGSGTRCRFSRSPGTNASRFTSTTSSPATDLGRAAVVTQAVKREVDKGVVQADGAVSHKQRRLHSVPVRRQSLKGLKGDDKPKSDCV